MKTKSFIFCLVFVMSSLWIAPKAKAQNSSSITNEYQFISASGNLAYGTLYVYFLFLDTPYPGSEILPGSFFEVPDLSFEVGLHFPGVPIHLPSLIVDYNNLDYVCALADPQYLGELRLDGSFPRLSLAGSTTIQSWDYYSNWTAINTPPPAESGAGVWVPVATPEPSTLALAMLGGGLLLLFAKQIKS